MGVETLQLQGRSLSLGFSLGEICYMKILCRWVLAWPVLSFQTWVLFLIFVGGNSDVWGLYHSRNIVAGGLWGLGSWVGVENPLNTAGVNTVPAWESVRLYWRPGVSKGIHWSRLWLCTGAAEGAGGNVTVLCIVISHQGCLTSTAVMTPVTRVSPAGLPRSCRVERSQSPVCRTSKSPPSQQSLSPAALPLKILCHVSRGLPSSHSAVLMAYFGQRWV